MAKKSKLLDQVRKGIRLHHMSYRTEQSYVDWIYRFIVFHYKQHPADVRTTMIYTHVCDRQRSAVKSPLDSLGAGHYFTYR